MPSIGKRDPNLASDCFKVLQIIPQTLWLENRVGVMEVARFRFSIARLCHPCDTCVAPETLHFRMVSVSSCHATVSRCRDDHNLQIHVCITRRLQPLSCTARSPLVPTPHIVVMDTTTVPNFPLSPITLCTVHWKTSLFVECIRICPSVPVHFS